MSQPLVTWVNGELVDSIEVNNRGLLYGDGFFETLWGKSGCFPFLPEHKKRLIFSCDKLSITLDWDYVMEGLLEAVRSSGVSGNKTSSVARITVTRGKQQGRGYQPSANARPDVIVSLFPGVEQNPDSRLVLGVCQQRIGSSTMLAGLKHLNRLENVLLKKESTDNGFEDSLVMDAEGYVIETTSSNLFLVCRDRLVTPKLDRSGVEGVMKRFIIDEVSTAAAIPVEERPVSLSDITRADELIITNAVTGPRRVAAVKGHRYYATNLGQRVLSRYARLRDNRLDSISL